MEIIQILATAGAISVLALAIGLFILSKIEAPTSDEPSYTKEELTTTELAKQLYNKDARPHLPTSGAITKDVLDQIVKKAKVLPEDIVIDLGKSDQTSKPKKKRKYYPKKPKTQL